VIPFDFITEWRQHAPWVQDAQVEQDLLIGRALVELYSQPAVSETLAFRGGTALHRLYLQPAARYSEDIDLVQVEAGPIGDTLSAVRACLDPWLGKPRRQLKDGSAVLSYRVQSEGPPALPLRLKVEINTREHFNVLGFEEYQYDIESRWFTGSAPIRTYALDELLGTKLRALYQRRKGRDLFDLWYAHRTAGIDNGRVVRCFRAYLGRSGLSVSRAEFEANLERKLSDPRFLGDITPLLAPESVWDLDAAARVARTLLVHLPGKPWKGRT
jgi:predicted nucleotidyltransferase component of viral defense system